MALHDQSFSSSHRVFLPTRLCAMCSIFVFPIEMVIQHMYMNVAFAKHAGEPQSHFFFDSPYMDRVDTKLCGAIKHPERNPHGARVVCFAIAADGAQLHENIKATTLVGALKCLGVPDHLIATLVASFSAFYFGGIKEPSVVTESIAVLIDGFIKYLPSKDGTRAFCDLSDVHSDHLQACIFFLLLSVVTIPFGPSPIFHSEACVLHLWASWRSLQPDLAYRSLL
jgi:hypothetical protein